MAKSPVRERVGIEARGHIPKSWKSACLQRSGHKCSRVGCEETDCLEFDHILPLAIGGKHHQDNIEPLCKIHHREKTNIDIKMIARSKRMAMEHGQQARRKKENYRPMPSRGFDKTVTRGFDGKVRKRLKPPPSKA